MSNILKDRRNQMNKQNNLKLKPQDIQYLYNGLLYFKPHLLNKTLTKDQYNSLSKVYGQLKESFFFKLVFMLTSSVSAEEAAKKIERWKHLAEEGKDVFPLTPLEESDIYKIDELVKLAEQPPSDYQKVLEKKTKEIENLLEKQKERRKKIMQIN